MSLCKDCPRSAEGLSCGSRGRLDAKIVIVGMAPGLDELAQGKPFIGPSGKILARAMLEAKLHPDQARMLNVINCPPAGGAQEVLRLNGIAFSNGKSISKEQGKACRGRLQEELASCLNAVVIVALGGEALQALTGISTQSSKWQNHPIARKELGISPVPPWVQWVLPLYHPAFVRYRGIRGEMAALKTGFLKVRRMLGGNYRIIDFNHLGPSLGLNELLGHEPLTFDIENPTGPITQMGFALNCADGSVRSGTWAWTPTVRKVAKQALEMPGRMKIAHNISHDIRYLLEDGIDVADPVFDTMLGHQLLQPEMEKSLDAVSGFLLDIPRWKHLSKASPELYNRLDAHATALLYPLLREALQEDEMLDLFQQKVMPGMRVLIRATKRGLRVHRRKLETWKLILQGKVGAAEEEFSSLTGGCNPRSPKQIHTLLYTTLGLPKMVQKGKVTADAGALEKLLKHLKKEVGKNRQAAVSLQIIQVLQAYRESHILLSTYAEIEGDVVHPSYFPVGKDDSRYGTATGRLSSQKPNIQNQPKSARSLYVPHTADMVLLEADFSQIELRVAAWRAPEPHLVDLFLRGQDVHAETQRLLQCDRTRAKNVTYGTLYGAGARRLYDTLVAEGFETTETEMRTLQAAFFRAYPGLLGWRQRLVDSATDHGFAVTVFKRRRYFYNPPKMVPEIVNHEPQSTVADVVWERLPYVERTFEEFMGHFLTTVHDSFLGEVPKKHWRECARALKTVLERPYPEIGEGFYCPVDLKVGRCWGSMHSVKEEILANPVYRNQ